MGRSKIPVNRFAPEPSSDQILEVCPDVIDKSEIPTINKGGVNQSAKVRQYKGGSPWYDEKTRIKAACVYAVTGSAAETGRILGVKSGTIRQWRLQPWWPQVIERIRSEHDDELDVRFTQVIDKTVTELNDRLEHGDYIFDVKEGILRRKPMGGKEVAVVTSIMMDKRSLLRERKKVRTEETAVMDRLKNLAKEFEKFVKAKDITPEKIVVEDVEEIKEEVAPADDLISETITDILDNKNQGDK